MNDAMIVMALPPSMALGCLLSLLASAWLWYCVGRHSEAGKPRDVMFLCAVGFLLIPIALLAASTALEVCQ